MAQKRKTADFGIKSHFDLRKSATKFLCLKTISRKVYCKAFIGLTIRAKMICGGRLLLPEILGQTDRVGAKSTIFDLFSPVCASTPTKKAKVPHTRNRA